MTTKKADKKPANAEEGPEPSFERALERLEKIVSEMESGTMSLEEMIGRFEEGQGLIRICTKKLNEVERKIEVLVKKGDDVTAEPFEEEESGGGDPKDDGRLL
jgi:exodeoxyribonuclease VII small subunit